jgi:hypothetical protein
MNHCSPCGFAPIKSALVIDVCQKVISNINDMQKERTDQYLKSRCNRKNRRRRFLSKFTPFKFRDLTIEDIKLELDEIIEAGGWDAINLSTFYPQDVTSEHWKETARKLMSLAKNSTDVIYVSADDWHVLSDFGKV